MTVRYALLSGLQGFLTLAFYIGALVFVLIRRTRLTPRGAGFAIGGVGLLLVGWLLAIAWPFVFKGFSSTFTSDSGDGFLMLAGVMSLVTGTMHIAAIALLLMALFDGRPSAGRAPAAWPGPDQPGSIVVAPAGPAIPASPGGVPPWPAPVDPTER